MSDPFRERALIGTVGRLGHGLDEMDRHLLRVVKGTADADRLDLPRPDPFAEIAEVALPHPERRTREDAGSVPVEEDRLEQLGHVHRSRIQAQRLAFVLLDPVDEPIVALVEESPEGGAAVGETAGQFTEFVLGRLIGEFGDGPGASAHLDETGAEGVLDEFRFADAELAAVFAPLAVPFDPVEELVDLVEQGHGEAPPLHVAGQLKEALLVFRIEKPVQVELHPRLREREPELPRRDLLEGVGLVKDEEILREEESLPRLLEFALSVQQGEKEGVIHDHDVGIGDPFASLLIKTFSGPGAAFRSAGVTLAADLRPDPLRGSEIEIAESAILRLFGPFPDQLQLLEF